MSRPAIRTISTSLLLALAWSCAGLGLGMIGRGFFAPQTAVSHIGHIETPQILQECCGAPSESGAAESDPIGGHHEADYAVFAGANQNVVAAALAVMVLAIALFVLLRAPDTIRLYVQYWRVQWSYFARLFSRLFSAGILHSKAW